MSDAYLESLDLRRQDAVRELSALITQRYPTASISVGPAEQGQDVTHITAVLDLDDPDEVADLVMDRMLELQLDEGIPIYVIPIRTLERVAALHDRQRAGAATAPAFPLIRTCKQ
jgi:hypothetical protein